MAEGRHSRSHGGSRAVGLPSALAYVFPDMAAVGPVDGGHKSLLGRSARRA